MSRPDEPVHRVPVHDKRGAASQAAGTPTSPLRSAPDEAAQADSSSASRSPDSASTPPLVGRGADRPSPTTSGSGPGINSDQKKEEEKHDYLADLQRVQAEFENYRKRIMREQVGITERATGQLLDRLLPVLDNFERAIAHGEGGEGVALVFRQLKETLAKEGLEEVGALGAPFDPQVHEAIAAHEDPDVSEPIVREVSRHGYSFKGQMLRPAMVVVATPPEDLPVRDAALRSENDEFQSADPDS